MAASTWAMLALVGITNAWASAQVLASRRRGRALWLAALWLLPIAGFALWVLLGPRRGPAREGG